MTNADIILTESIRLSESGKIGTTGRMITIETDSGAVREIPEPEAIHTYDEWKRMGLQVRRGEHAVAAFPIWVLNRKKEKLPAKDVKTGEVVEITEESRRFVKKTAYFFSFSQVDLPGQQRMAYPEPAAVSA